MADIDKDLDSEEILARILRRDARALALGAESSEVSQFDGDQQDLADRAALQRVPGLSTQLQDISEVEYRELQL
ncbi:MAG: GTPase HflX, partial [Micrococcales bacterium]|nr:GTPase HflX [Micrococcales bacterium]